MSSSRALPARAKILGNATQAFLAHGYTALSMGQLADLCGLTRRALYHHFSSKEDVFRAMVQVNNVEAVSRGDASARDALARDASAVDVIAAWLDARFGSTRRNIANSPHGRELNDTAFRLATDIMIEVSYESNRKLADLVAELSRSGRLVLRPGVSPEKAGRLIGDGARGVNQQRPPIPPERIAQHYWDIVDAILFGCAVRGN